jgi:BlaI family transcriptional regulator, penicillinase repressor
VQLWAWSGAMKKDLESYIPTRRELQILKVLWEKGSASVHEVQDATFQTERLSYNTVLTLMRILYQKGMLSHKKSGRVHIYEALLPQETAARNQVSDMIIRFFDGKPDKLIESILDYEYRDAEHLEELKSFVESRLTHIAFASDAIDGMPEEKSIDAVKRLSLKKPRKIEESSNSIAASQR